MDNPNAVSNLPTYSNALNFNCCQYQYEVPVVNLIEAYDSDDEVDYYDFRNCRIQMEKYAKEVTVLMQKNAHENEKIPHVPKEAISQIQNKEAKIPHVIRKPSTDKIAQNLIMKNSLADKINGNVPKTESSTLVKKSVNATPDLIQDSISVIVSEEVLCLCVDGKIEKYDVRGTVGVSYVTQNNNSDDNDNGIAINVISDSIKEDTNKLRNTTASLQLKFDDTEGILTNIKANSSFITSPVIPDLSKQDLKVDNIQKNSPDKISAIMKYSAISTFQPCYFKARNKMKIQLPNAKILIQIKLNPIYKIFFTNIDSFIVQASFSCFLFDKNSNVILRPCDKFNENTKIVTWVCGTIDLEKEDTIQLECSLEGISFSKEEYNLKHPEHVPLIIKSSSKGHLLTAMNFIAQTNDNNEIEKVKMNEKNVNGTNIYHTIDNNSEIKHEDNDNNNNHDNHNNESINEIRNDKDRASQDNTQSHIYTSIYKSKVEFRFF